MTEKENEEIKAALAELRREFQEHLGRDEERDRLVEQLWKSRLLYLLIIVMLGGGIIGALIIMLAFG